MKGGIPVVTIDLKAASSGQVMLKDFCDPASQADEDFKRALAIIDKLYAALITKFEAEFASSERAALRTLFLIEHGDPAQNQSQKTRDALFTYDGKNLGKSLVAVPATVELPVEFGWSGASGVAYPSSDGKPTSAAD